MAHLANFLDSWRKVVQRTGRVLRGEARSVRPGQPPQDLKSELEFELVTFAGEGDSVSLGLERRLENTSFPEMDFGLRVLQSAVRGLGEIESGNVSERWPAGMDTGILRAWRDAGALFSQGIDAIAFTVNGPQGAISAELTSSLLAEIRERLTRPQVNVRKIAGRLLMVDFTGEEAHCRIQPEDGEPVECLVDEGGKDAVITHLLSNVVITGEAQTDPATGETTAISIKEIEPRPAPPSEPDPPPSDSAETPEPPSLLDEPHPPAT